MHSLVTVEIERSVLGHDDRGTRSKFEHTGPMKMMRLIQNVVHVVLIVLIVVIVIGGIWRGVRPPDNLELCLYLSVAALGSVGMMIELITRSIFTV